MLSQRDLESPSQNTPDSSSKEKKLWRRQKRHSTEIGAEYHRWCLVRHAVGYETNEHIAGLLLDGFHALLHQIVVMCGGDTFNPSSDNQDFYDQDQDFDWLHSLSGKHEESEELRDFSNAIEFYCDSLSKMCLEPNSKLFELDNASRPMQDFIIRLMGYLKLAKSKNFLMSTTRNRILTKKFKVGNMRSSLEGPNTSGPFFMPLFSSVARSPTNVPSTPLQVVTPSSTIENGFTLPTGLFSGSIDKRCQTKPPSVNFSDDEDNNDSEKMQSYSQCAVNIDNYADIETPTDTIRQEAVTRKCTSEQEPWNSMSNCLTRTVDGQQTKLTLNLGEGLHCTNSEVSSCEWDNFTAPTIPKGAKDKRSPTTPKSQQEKNSAVSSESRNLCDENNDDKYILSNTTEPQYHERISPQSNSEQKEKPSKRCLDVSVTAIEGQRQSSYKQEVSSSNSSVETVSKVSRSERHTLKNLLRNPISPSPQCERKVMTNAVQSDSDFDTRIDEQFKSTNKLRSHIKPLHSQESTKAIQTCSKGTNTTYHTDESHLENTLRPKAKSLSIETKDLGSSNCLLTSEETNLQEASNPQNQNLPRDTTILQNLSTSALYNSPASLHASFSGLSKLTTNLLLAPQSSTSVPVETTSFQNYKQLRNQLNVSSTYLPQVPQFSFSFPQSLLSSVSAAPITSSSVYTQLASSQSTTVQTQSSTYSSSVQGNTPLCSTSQVNRSHISEVGHLPPPLNFSQFPTLGTPIFLFPPLNTQNSALASLSTQDQSFLFNSQDNVLKQMSQFPSIYSATSVPLSVTSTTPSSLATTSAIKETMWKKISPVSIPPNSAILPLSSTFARPGLLPVFISPTGINPFTGKQNYISAVKPGQSPGAPPKASQSTQQQIASKCDSGSNAPYTSKPQKNSLGDIQSEWKITDVRSCSMDEFPHASEWFHPHSNESDPVHSYKKTTIDRAQFDIPECQGITGEKLKLPMFEPENLSQKTNNQAQHKTVSRNLKLQYLPHSKDGIPSYQQKAEDSKTEHKHLLNEEKFQPVKTDPGKLIADSLYNADVGEEWLFNSKQDKSPTTAGKESRSGDPQRNLPIPKSYCRLHCTVCQQKFQSGTDLLVHRYEQHSFVCGECDSRFLFEARLDAHKMTHHPNIVMCSKCMFYCPSKKGMAQHLEEAHGIVSKASDESADVNYTLEMQNLQKQEKPTSTSANSQKPCENEENLSSQKADSPSNNASMTDKKEKKIRKKHSGHSSEEERYPYSRAVTESKSDPLQSFMSSSVNLPRPCPGSVFPSFIRQCPAKPSTDYKSVASMYHQVVEHCGLNSLDFLKSCATTSLDLEEEAPPLVIDTTELQENYDEKTEEEDEPLCLVKNGSKTIRALDDHRRILKRIQSIDQENDATSEKRYRVMNPEQDDSASSRLNAKESDFNADFENGKRDRFDSKHPVRRFNENGKKKKRRRKKRKRHVRHRVLDAQESAGILEIDNAEVASDMSLTAKSKLTITLCQKSDNFSFEKFSSRANTISKDNSEQVKSKGALSPICSNIERSPTIALSLHQRHHMSSLPPKKRNFEKSPKKSSTFNSTPSTVNPHNLLKIKKSIHSLTGEHAASHSVTGSDSSKSLDFSCEKNLRSHVRQHRFRDLPSRRCSRSKESVARGLKTKSNTSNEESVKEFSEDVSPKDHPPSTIRRFTCPIPECTASFTRRWNMGEHIIKVHHGSGILSCGFKNCDKKYLTRKELKQHVAVDHKGKSRRFLCTWPDCVKAFFSQTHLRVHMFTHTGEKPVACHLCDYRCRQRAALVWHMRKHGVFQKDKDMKLVS